MTVGYFSPAHIRYVLHGNACMLTYLNFICSVFNKSAGLTGIGFGSYGNGK